MDDRRRPTGSRGRRPRRIAAALTGVSVAAFSLWWLASAASWGREDARASPGELPLGWWVVFGGLAVIAGCGAAAVVHAALRKRPPG